MNVSQSCGAELGLRVHHDHGVTVTAQTSVSETIRKPPLAARQSQTALRKQKNTAKNDFQYSGWNSSSLCNFDQIAVICILNQVPKFRPNRATRGGVMTSYTISRWRQQRLHTTFGFVFNVTLFRSSKSIYRPNFIDIKIISIYGWDITISGLEKQSSAILEFLFRLLLRP